VSVTLVRGDDPALLAGEVRRVIDAALAGADRSLALEDLGADELTVGAVVDACHTPPFLADRRVVVARDVARWSSDEVAGLVEYLAAPLETTALVLVDGGGGRLSQKLLNAVKKAGTVIDAGLPNAGRARTAWLVERLSASGLRFDAAAGTLLGEHLGEDLGRLDALIAILTSVFGAGARVGVAEVEPYLGAAGAVAPWDLTDAIDRGDTPAALTVLGRLMGAGERHALAVLAILHRHYAAMLRLDGAGVRIDTEAAALVGMAPFPAGKALRQAQRLGTAGVARAITLLAQADLDLRGLKDWPDQLVIEVLVARLSRLGPKSPARARR